MRTLHKYLVLSYIGPFIMTFLIAVFILFIRWVYVYIDDLVGKGLGGSVLAELFFYVALNTFSLALPLAILLSSLMTFGNLGEHFELVALKSSGMSLQKIMFPLMIVALLTSMGAFFFSNNVLPYVNLKMQSLIYDIQQKKPALNIKDGIFYNGIDGYTIRIEKKEKDGSSCSGILIYDHTSGMGNTKVITAETGKMETTADKHFLILTLYNGTSFEELINEKTQTSFPLVRSRFKEQVVRFDLSGFKMERTDEGLFKSNYAMLNMRQINEALDSLKMEQVKKAEDFKKNFTEMLSEKSVLAPPPPDTVPRITLAPLIVQRNLPGQQNQNVPGIGSAVSKAQVLDFAMSIARSKKHLIESAVTDLKNYSRPVISLNIEWHRKLTLSIACLILFFIGAPLGAIIRKGGLGMPVVVSVIFFILFWVMSISGEKMAKEGVIPPYIGMWIATAVTLPLGIFLTAKATSDSSLFDTESYLRPFRKLFRRAENIPASPQ